MKILLIDPPFKRFTGFVNFYFPIGLTYLAAILREAGYSVSIFDVDAIQKGYDLDFSDEYRRLELYRQGLNNENHAAWQEINQVLENFNPDVVGITSMTTKFGSVLKTAEIVKKYNAGCKVIVGGPHATLLPELTLKSVYIDIVVRGEGEKTFLNLIKRIENNEDFQDVKGISFKIEGRIRHNQQQEFIEDLDELPFPARDALMNQKDYTSEDMGAIMTSRGCPFNCNYCCHMWEKRVRNRSIENVIREMREVKRRYGTRQFEFRDDSFTLNKKRTLEFCERLISEELDIDWSCSTRVDLLDEGLIRKMKKAGCNAIKLGIESGSERILRETNKGIDFEQIRKVAALLNKYRMFWSGYFMLGLPTETEEDIKKTYEFMKEINPYYAGLGVYNPFPATKLFEDGIKIGLLLPDVELEHFFNTNPKDYFFIDPRRRVLNIPKEKFDGLIDFMSKAFHRHNTKFSNIARRAWARRKTYLSDRALFFSDIKKALTWLYGSKKMNKRPKFLLLTNYFPPEIGGAAHLFYELSDSLVKKGYEITVVTGFPRWNIKQIDDKYKGKLFMKEIMGGIKVIRMWIPNLPRKNVFGRGIEHLLVSAQFYIGGLLAGKQDTILIYSPPLTLGISAYLLKLINKAPFIINIQDLFPRHAIALGILKNKFIINFFESMEKFVYSKADYITIHSPSAADHILKRGGDISRLQVLYNWVDIERMRPGEKENPFSLAHGLHKKFIVSYAGTMGWGQDMQTIIKAADLLREYDEILFILVGEGIEKKSSEIEIKNLRLSNVKFFPMQPWSVYPQILNASDISLINLNKNLTTPTVPSKLFNIMASGIAVVASLPLDGDTASIIKDAQCGICVQPGDPFALSKAILCLYKNPSQRLIMGKNGRIYAEKHFSKEIHIAHYEEIFNRIQNKR
jgi:radical SAM superfamily enzyme YgiQ (UPF0313 family)/glycosyltransferase involved in cell wall biosynthesis